MTRVLPAQALAELPRLEQALQRDNVPRHVAVIMDGNGRWGELQGLSRCEGHFSGVDSIRRTVTAASDHGVKFLSLYSFSTENLNRPREEVEFLFKLFADTMLDEVNDLDAKNIRVAITGQHAALPQLVQDAFRAAEARTAGNTGLTMNLCVMYSGRMEIVDAARRIAEDVAAGALAPAAISEELLRGYLYHPEIPDPDLVIRTSGEQRISNFLLWQMAYSELVFTEVLWPDFSRADFLAALLEYQQRHRRFGGV